MSIPTADANFSLMDIEFPEPGVMCIRIFDWTHSNVVKSPSAWWWAYFPSLVARSAARGRAQFDRPVLGLP